MIITTALLADAQLAQSLGNAAWLGDSLTYGWQPGGTQLPIPPPAELAILLGVPVANFGVPGDTAAQGLTNWTNNVRSHGYNSLILLCTVNSSVSYTAAQAFASLQTILDQARTDGLRCIVLGTTPWKGSAGWTAPRQTFCDDVDALLLAYSATNGLTFISTKAMGGGGGDPLSLQTAYDCGDGIHHTQAGAIYLAQLVFGAL